MSNFTPLVKQEYTFEDDTVAVEFSRLKRKHMLDALPALARMNESRPKEGEDATDEQLEELNDAMNEVLDAIVDVIPEYVTSFEGLIDANNNPVGIEMACSAFYFVKLTVQIAVGMLEASSGHEGKV